MVIRPNHRALEARPCPGITHCSSYSGRKLRQLWQHHCRNAKLTWIIFLRQFQIALPPEWIAIILRALASVRWVPAKKKK
jgi:hypothetical protein